MDGCGCNERAIEAPTNSDFTGKSNGHPVVIWPGWQNFDARASVQTDVIPLPVSPVHFQNWPEMQYQLSNGWQYTNYGARMPYDDYMRMLYSSTSSPRAPKPLPGEGLQPTGYSNSSLVSQVSLQNAMSANAPSGGKTNGSGALNPGVSLAGRTYYG